MGPDELVGATRCISSESLAIGILTIYMKNASLSDVLSEGYVGSVHVSKSGMMDSERLATFTRKCRHAAQRLQALESGMYLIGSVYNFCCFHHELSKLPGGAAHTRLRSQTPAMASGLTDHRWSVSEVLRSKLSPDPWVEPKRQGRPRTRPLPAPNVPKRPRGRPRKIPLSSFTV